MLVRFGVRGGRLCLWSQWRCSQALARAHLAATPGDWASFAARNAELATALARHHDQSRWLRVQRAAPDEASLDLHAQHAVAFVAPYDIQDLSVETAGFLRRHQLAGERGGRVELFYVVGGRLFERC